MDSAVTRMVWKQFGAALDTLDDALTLCPDEHWTAYLWDDEEDQRYGEFWFIAYHSVFWTDAYMADDLASFKPPAPFVRGRLPDQPYTRAQVQNYLKQTRAKVKDMLENLTAEQAFSKVPHDWLDATYLEMQLYSMRHVQEHAAQLNFVLGRQGITGQDWVSEARE